MTRFFKFKTLQARLIFFLLIPVFIIILAGGVVSFIYTRDAMLDQWNESSALKLQRAAHTIEMRLLKPLELLEVLFQKADKEKAALSLGQVMAFLEAMEGVLQVDFQGSLEKGLHKDPIRSPADQMNQMNQMHPGEMRVYRSRISKISNLEYDTDKGGKSLTITVSLSGPSGGDLGTLDIRISFDYLLKDIIALGWWQSDMACIVDQSGKYMAHTNMTMIGREFLGDTDDPLERDILDQMMFQPYGTVRSAGHPPHMIAGYYKLEHVPWAVILFAPGEKILKPIITYRNYFALGSLGLVMVILMLIRLHVGKIVNHIRLLSDKARKVAKGDYGSPIPVDSEDEIGQLILSYNEMVKGLEERDFIRNSFGRYVDPEFARILLKHPEASRLGGKRREVAILMSDIRGFTALSETLSPEIIVRILNQYFSHMIQIIQHHQGIIVDFFGDSILVFFDPLSDTLADTVFRCVQCATQMQDQMVDFNKDMDGKELPKLAMGIGINAGQVIVGNIGSHTRSKYGIVGSAVNITSRIQAKAGEHEILISDVAHGHIQERVEVQRSFPASLKGVDQPVQLHVVQPLSGRR